MVETRNRIDADQGPRDLFAPAADGPAVRFYYRKFCGSAKNGLSLRKDQTSGDILEAAERRLPQKAPELGRLRSSILRPAMMRSISAAEARKARSFIKALKRASARNAEAAATAMASVASATAAKYQEFTLQRLRNRIAIEDPSRLNPFFSAKLTDTVILLIYTKWSMFLARFRVKRQAQETELVIIIDYGQNNEHSSIISSEAMDIERFFSGKADF